MNRIAFLLLLAAANGVAQEEVLLDGVAATVGDEHSSQARVILRSDVSVRAGLHSRRGRRTPSPDQWRASLRELVAEHLLAMEAARTGAARVTPEERATALVDLESLAGGSDSLRDLLAEQHVSTSELDEMLTTRALARRFLAQNLTHLHVTDAEVRERFDSGHHIFADAAFEAAQEPLRAILLREKIEAAVLRWATTLQARIPVAYAPALHME